MIATIAAWAAKSTLMQSPVGGFLRRVPRRIWKWLIIALVVGLAIFFVLRWHSNKVEAFGNERFKAGYAQAIANGKEANRKVDARSATITSKIRSNTDAKLRDSARRADTVRLRGPGAAACLHPRVPAAAGGHDQAIGGTGRAVAGVPGEERVDLIAVPFDVAVDRAETNDANRIEASAWRQWHGELTAWWNKVRAEAEKRNAEAAK